MGCFQETKLQLFSLDGIKKREWLLESIIRYIKVHFSDICWKAGFYNDDF